MVRPAASLTRAASVLAVAIAFAGCHKSQGAEAAGALVEEPCTGVPVADARCLRLTVYEDQSVRRGRTIGLRLVVLPVLPATRTDGARRERDAVVYLAGGPGQAASGLIGESSAEMAALRSRRDIVYADQRGTGGSNPLLCQFYGPPDQPQSYFDAFLPIEKVRQCRTALERASDLRQYTTSASVEDLEAIRVALKYPRITLVGGSYGTRLAMEYVRRYESRVRAVVLEGPVTPANHVPEHFGQFAERALAGLIDECRADAGCARAFPAIRDEARQVFARLREKPATAVVSHPSTRQAGTVTLTRDHVAEAIRYMMYSSLGASRVPLYLHEAFNGDFSSIAAFLMRWRAEGTFDGLYLSITCAEDVPLVAADAAERDEPTYLGSYRVRQQRAACAEWPRGARPDGSLQPVTTGVPILLTSGTLDPVTPAENGDTLARTLAESLHVRVPFGGHSPYGLNGLACLDDLKRAFIERASTVGLDTACVTRITRPGFVTAR